MTTQFQDWTEGLAALRERAEEVRGTVEDGDAAWPKTTNGDVITIASVIDPSLKARFHSSDLGRRWDAVRAETWHAFIAPHAATYAKNAEFWAAVTEVCTYLDEVPVPDLWGVLADHLGDAELRNACPKEDGPLAHFEAATYDDLWSAQRKFLVEKRGSDKLPPPTGFGGGEMVIPRATNADVLQIATYWSKELTNAKRVMGYDGKVAMWKVAIDDVDRIAKTGKPDAVYSKNNEFWRSAFEVAVQIAIGDESPGKWSMFVDSLKYSVGHLPQTLGTAASKSVDFVAGAGRAAGHIANEVGKGLFSGFGTPLLIGGGLIGLYLITRSRDHAEG
jgi:hypothetical protein